MSIHRQPASGPEPELLEALAERFARSLHRLIRAGGASSVVVAALVLGIAAWSPVAGAAGRSPVDGDKVDLQARPSVRRHALVVGTNATLDPSQSALRFADDDAARIAELLLQAGVDVELVTSLDRESQGVFPELVGRASLPRERELEQAWARLRGRMQEAKDDGDRVEFLFFYSGHGDVGPDGQGFLTLQGGKITRRDLFGELLSKSVADYNHVLIDACRSEQFVLSRGKTWKPDRNPADASREVQKYLDRQHLGAFPNTGVILAHSADQQTHEWESYRGGIFSHELISGLRGAADLNGDGRIEYSELGAFVSAANSAVADPRARLEVVVRPPSSDERRPLLEHEAVAQQRVLLFSGRDPGLYTIEDERGLRLADVRRAGDSPGYVRLPDGPIFVQRDADGPRVRPLETLIPADTNGVIRVAQLHFEPSRRASRGALDQAFREGLFATPFGYGYYAGYTDQRGLLPVREPKWHAQLWDEPGAETLAETEPPATVAAAPQAPEPTTPAEPPEEPPEDQENLEEPWIREGTTWGGIQLGTVITPFDPDGNIEASRRVTSNQFRGCLSPLQSTTSACSPVRGFDLRWQIFRTSAKKKYPRLLGYFRTGYTAGHAEFQSDGPRVNGEALRMSYLTVPLFFGGNIYAFDRFPLRPYAGLGAGLDVLRVDYDRHVPEPDPDNPITDPGINPELRDVSARIGFELHAGLELRIRNIVTLSAEVMQLWSARRNLNGVPDYSNEGFTVIMGVSYGFALERDDGEPRKKTVKKVR